MARWFLRRNSAAPPVESGRFRWRNSHHSRRGAARSREIARRRTTPTPSATSRCSVPYDGALVAPGTSARPRRTRARRPGPPEPSNAHVRARPSGTPSPCNSDRVPPVPRGARRNSSGPRDETCMSTPGLSIALENRLRTKGNHRPNLRDRSPPSRRGGPLVTVGCCRDLEWDEFSHSLVPPEELHARGATRGLR